MQAGRVYSFRLLLVFTFASLLVEVKRVDAHDDLARRMLVDGDASRAGWFETLKTPSGESCCNMSDCRPTRAEWRSDTEGWWAHVNGKWRPVPADKVLTSPRSIDGAAYLCMGRDPPYGHGSLPGDVTSMLGAIFCFVPPDLGS
jgi:hypothetical protein